MKLRRAVMYGAGNIGRGFIGQQFSEAGYEVVFIDVKQEIIQAMNRSNRYPIKIVSDTGKEDIWVEHIWAIDGRDERKVVEIIAGADIMATAVGVHILPNIVKIIAKGLKLRWQQENYVPLNILLCENLLNVEKYFSYEIGKYLSYEEKELMSKYIGFVRTSIGRMVPVMTKERQRDNLLGIWVEPYCSLPVDQAAIKGEILKMKNLIPYTPFDFYVEKKLYIHNMGHAITAYLGQLSGYTYIDDAIKDPLIKLIVLKAMQESAIALSRKYKMALDGLLVHVDELLYRFRNPYLGDTILRVGKDPVRKLKAKDRLIGAAICCQNNKLNPVYISFGIGAALCFRDEEDNQLSAFHKSIKTNGLILALEALGLIDGDSKILNNIVYFYELLKSGKGIAELITEIEYKKVG